MELYDMEAQKVLKVEDMTKLDAELRNHDFRTGGVFRRWVPANTFIDSKMSRKKEALHAKAV